MNIQKIQTEAPIACDQNHPGIITLPNNIVVGDKDLVIIAGPCAVESWEQLIETAERVKKAGADILRGGCWKPRSKWTSFQGLEETALEMLVTASQQVGMPIITELVDPRHLPLFEKAKAIVQLGSRNAQNYHLQKSVSETPLPVFLKRGMYMSLEKWLASAEYVMTGAQVDGPIKQNVILCERGVQMIPHPGLRNHLDVDVIRTIKRRGLTHLPIAADPSHATGKRDLVAAAAVDAVLAGADMIMVEVHNDPDNALCDGKQSLTIKEFEELVPRLHKTRKLFLATNS